MKFPIALLFASLLSMQADAEPPPFQPPAWPQNWAVNNAEPAGFAFGVTQPGTVTVHVQSQGAPIVVMLFGAAPQPIQQSSGAGAVRLAYQVTPADLQHSALWQVRIALAQPGGLPAQASGTVAVQSPPVDVNVVRAETQARMARRPAGASRAETRVNAQPDARVQAEFAAFETQQAARRAASLAELQPHLQSARARLQGGVRTRGLGSPGVVSPGRRPTFTAVVPPPAIQWFSGTRGQPGDPLMITGTNFGARTPASKVNFTLLGDPPRGGPVNLDAPIQEWNDGMILMSVPDASGIVSGRQVEITVTRGSDGGSNVPQGGFMFLPAMELRQLSLPPPFGESRVQSPLSSLEARRPAPDLELTGIAGDPSVPPGWFIHRFFNAWQVHAQRADWMGYRGNDLFFMNKRLQNGWKVTKAELVFLNRYERNDHVWCWSTLQSGGAYVAESRVGTNSPYLNVRVWLDPYCTIAYAPRIWIQGPKGVPHE